MSAGRQEFGTDFHREVVRSLIAHGFTPAEVMELIGIKGVFSEDHFRAIFKVSIVVGEALLAAHPKNLLPSLAIARRAAAGDLEAVAELARQHPEAARQAFGLVPPSSH